MLGEGGIYCDLAIIETYGFIEAILQEGRA
jgi:hypothetical protein